MSYKSASIRATAPPEQSKYRSQAKTLQELFPAWSNDDLQSLLAEVGGDLQIAATRISEGRAEQWGSVTRKKDKKPSAHSQSKDSLSGRVDRGDFRGGRGGRSGGRGGGPGRGSASARPPRGTGASPAHGNGPINGHSISPSTSASSAVPQNAWASTVDSSIVDKIAETSSGGWRTADQDATPVAAPLSSETVWGDSTTTETNTTSGWGATSITNTRGSVNGSTVKSPPTPASNSTPALVKSSKIPPGSKLSWAQIARPHENPTSPPVPASAPSIDPQPTISSQPELLPEAEAQQTGWEEPTTVQPPTWDDEPQPPAAISVSSSASTGLWPSSVPEELKPSPSEEQPVPPAFEPVDESSNTVSLENPPTPPKPIAPRSKFGTGVRYKSIDQPVVMPSSSFGGALEKVGMQFGSLSLGSETLFDSGDLPASDVTVIRGAESTPAESLQQPAAPSVNDPPPPHSPSASAALGAGPSSSAIFQSIPQQLPTQPQQSTPNIGLPSSISAPSVPSQSQASPAGFSHQQSLSGHHPPNQQQTQAQHHQYAQHGLPTHIDPAQNQSQTQVQHSPQQQHQSQQQAQQPQQQQQAQPPQNHSGPYFKQAEQQPQGPYFHTPTPPAGQSQGQGGQDYGGFSGLAQGVGGGVGHQGHVQGGSSHLGGFSGSEYGYADSQRNFYESYGQQGGFGNRNTLGHDDGKGLPGTQQQPPSSVGLPPQANSQSSQGHPPSTATAGGQPQPSGGQGPQQYPPPLPYYYPYPQNQYYGAPYNQGYGVPQPPFVKYPAMFQPGPPGAAPSPTAKQGPANVQPQSNPYGQSLYGQQHPSTSYDDLSYQHHTQPHQHHNHAQGVGANLPASEYSKQHQQPQLYGTSQGMQSFIGLGHGSGPSATPQRGSPEAAYKPYATQGKDIGSGVGVGQTSVGGTVAQGRPGVQQPQQTAFYGGNRFGGATGGSGPQGGQSQQQHQHHQSQGQGPQGHTGYPQGGGEGNFYSYQPRGQQGYWQ